MNLHKDDIAAILEAVPEMHTRSNGWLSCFAQDDDTILVRISGADAIMVEPNTNWVWSEDIYRVSDKNIRSVLYYFHLGRIKNLPKVIARIKYLIEMYNKLMEFRATRDKRAGDFYEEVEINIGCGFKGCSYTETGDTKRMRGFLSPVNAKGAAIEYDSGTDEYRIEMTLHNATDAREAIEALLHAGTIKDRAE